MENADEISNGKEDEEEIQPKKKTKVSTYIFIVTRSTDYGYSLVRGSDCQPHDHYTKRQYNQQLPVD